MLLGCQAAELEVKATQLREEDLQREVRGQTQLLEQRAAEVDRLNKVRREKTPFSSGRHLQEVLVKGTTQMPGMACRHCHPVP